METTSLYLHIPFCRQRCSYCDFNTFAGVESRIPAYVDALCRELREVAGSAGERIPVHTIFFGGGTPSLLAVEDYRRILGTIRDHFDLKEDAESTLEANPGTVTQESLAGLRAAGFNRISFGMQSAHEEDLRLMGRIHRFPEVIQAVNWGRQAGFTEINLDLIFGLPNQLMDRWKKTLESAIQLNPEHLSLYSLTVEEGTPLHQWVERGMVPMPDDDLAAEMYEWAMERLEGAGYRQYEISNWAKDNGSQHACLHNLQYWRNAPYLGFGAGAHGYCAGKRLVNDSDLEGYIQKCVHAVPDLFPRGPATVEVHPIDRWDEIQETMMVGLRLVEEGVGAADFQKRFGLELEALFEREIRELVRAHLLEWVDVESEKRLRLTRKGRLLGNLVFQRFVGGKKPAALERSLS